MLRHTIAGSDSDSGNSTTISLKPCLAGGRSPGTSITETEAGGRRALLVDPAEVLSAGLRLFWNPMTAHSPPEIYPMPSFPILTVRDLEASSKWYQEVLGFQHVFTIPGPAGPVLVHLRWIRFADILLRRQMGSIEEPKGLGISLSFSVFEGGVDAIADRARHKGATLESEPKNQPWNARDFSLRDPDGFLLTFTQGPVDPGLGMDQIIRKSTGQER